MDNIQIGISGYLGRMGQELVNHAKKDKRINYTGGFDIKDTNKIINEIFDKSDVVIDFSSPLAIKQNIDLAVSNKTALVIGTTGLNEKNINQLKNASKKIPILVSSNMSLGVNLLFNLVEKTASILKDADYDIEIAETHHKHKKDAPSGTAISLGEYAAKGRKTKLKNVKVLDRTKTTTVRKKGDIGFSVTRGGEVPGEHTVSFIGHNDRIDLFHKASNRSIFVSGAIEASIFVSKKKRGFFNMKDLF